MRRLTFAALLAAGVAGLVVEPSVGQNPAQPPAAAAPAQKGNPPEDVSFESIDGVKLNARWWKQKSGGRGPVVMLLPATDKDPTKGWDDLGSELSGAGFNVLRLEWRGTKSNDIATKQFFQDTYYLSAVNKALVKDANKPNKTTLAKGDLRNGYFPMLVNDIMAARSYLERKNDEGAVNLSSLYLIGAENAATLGFLYMTAEWKREAKQANLAQPRAWINGGITPRNFIPANSDAAAKDIAGAVWLTPLRDKSVPSETIKRWTSAYAPELRTETPMLLLAGKDDAVGQTASDFFFDQVLLAKKKSKDVQPLPLTFNREIAKTKLSGSALLGDDAKYGVETQIKKFLETIEKDRKNKAPLTREYAKPLPVVLTSFGVSPG